MGKQDGMINILILKPPNGVVTAEEAEITLRGA